MDKPPSDVTFKLKMRFCFIDIKARSMIIMHELESTMSCAKIMSYLTPFSQERLKNYTQTINITDRKTQTILPIIFLKLLFI